MVKALSAITDYLNSPGPTICELDVQPFECEFWTLDELEQFNKEYEVTENAPGCFGFATSGGGEMFAIDPEERVVCLPFIGMAPSAALVIAQSWSSFLAMLRLYGEPGT